jgi:hypothetical protein
MLDAAFCVLVSKPPKKNIWNSTMARGMLLLRWPRQLTAPKASYDAT